jgi:hypothetical protein
MKLYHDRALNNMLIEGPIAESGVQPPEVLPKAGATAQR